MDKPFMSNNGVFHGFCPFLNVFFPKCGSSSH